MWGELLVATSLEVSEMGDEDLKGCADRVLEINYNPIVYTKTTPESNKWVKQFFILGHFF